MTAAENELRARYLAMYDEQLRGDSETAGAVSVVRHGPLWLVEQTHGRGFITYQQLDADEARVRALVADALDHFQALPEIESVEWKTRGHDSVPGLLAALAEHGFAPEAPESIMIGEAAALAVDVELPEGVSLRRVTEDADVRALSAMGDEVFGEPVSEAMAEALIRRLAEDSSVEAWVAEVNGQIVSGGRLVPVHGSDFAGIWGGATRAEWRGRGIYRAMTAARARAALAQGKTFINSDSTEFSRPILERSWFLKVSTTTPYTWKR